MPEAWDGQKAIMDDAVKEGIIVPASKSSDIYIFGWYVPAFTAKRNTRLLSHYGMTENIDDRENRRLLARTFLRPMTWAYFCDKISLDNCTTPYYDDEGLLIAARPPSDEAEDGKFFLADSYHGHFAATEDNDCDANPLNCTGHLVHPPCGWSHYTLSQARHLGIHVKGNGPDTTGGYSYDQIREIFKAANYTKSDALYVWYTPDPSLQEYLGTDAEFQRILLPPPTKECLEARPTEEERCSTDPIIRFGREEGSCDYAAQIAARPIASSLQKSEPNVDETYKSPAYDTVRNIEITNLQLDYMFRRWSAQNIDPLNYDPRDAVCMWAAENAETLLSFIPESHPRSFRKEEQNRPVMFGAIATAAISIIIVAAVSILTFFYREKKVMVCAQPIFLYMLLGGLFFLGVGAILNAVSASQDSCIAQEWFVLIGYSLELTPLIVKVAAVNRIFQSATRFQKATIDKKKLYMSVSSIIILVAIYLLTWTLVDPPDRQSNRRLTDDINEDGGQIIEIGYLCRSDSAAWFAISYVYQFVVLVAATVLAFQNRNVRQEFNDSSRLAFIIYAHSILLLLRMLVVYYGSSLKTNLVATITSYLLSADIIQTLAIYFVPKLHAASTISDRKSERSPICDKDSKLSSVEKIRLSAAQKSLMDESNPNKMNCPKCGYKSIQQTYNVDGDDIPKVEQKKEELTTTPNTQDRNEE
mmetsp:Transcript_7699/g.10668  ORF Transcript_7699/g.10668 Transcript_7699/m.10668 type:complete len:700 (+) Transcript_7699:666-2765(+)